MRRKNHQIEAEAPHLLQNLVETGFVCAASDATRPSSEIDGTLSTGLRFNEAEDDTRNIRKALLPGRVLHNHRH
jgi:hypothetical protein